MDTQILEEIGLTNGEIKAYLALLKLGSSSTGPIAKESGVSRSKLYVILDKLEKKGLVSHVEQDGVRHFQSADPVKVKDFIKERKDRLKKLDENFDKFLPQLEAFHAEAGRVQSVKVYQGFKGMKTAHEFIYRKLKKGDTFHCIGIPRYPMKSYHLYWHKDHIRRMKAGIKVKLLYNRDTEKWVLKNRNSYKDSDARYMPTDIMPPAWIQNYKDVVLIVVPSNNPIAIQIVSQEIADAFNSYFKEYWKESVPYVENNNRRRKR